MRAIVYNPKPLNWAACRLLRGFWKGCVTSKIAGMRLCEMDAPPLPGEDWVCVRTLLGGLCGTDLGIIAQKVPIDSILQAYSSRPLLLGHENVAVVEAVGDNVDGSWVGRRVCVEPTLSCAVRGIDPPCDRCKVGEFGACESFGADGEGKSSLPPGTSIGYNNLTGGSYGTEFVAHVSQLVAVPDELRDEQAILTDPIACGLHAALRVDLSVASTILVYGSGSIGLSVIAALRAIGFTGRIDALDQQDYLQPLAVEAGASEYLQLSSKPLRRFARIAKLTGGSVQQARFGNLMISGGYDVVFDCAGVKRSLEESLKWTRARGQVVLVGTGGGRGVDLTPIWFRELTVHGAYGRQVEHLDGREVGTYKLTHELLVAGKIKTTGWLTHTFPLSDYRTAFSVAMHKAAHQAVKVAFEFR